MYTLKFRPEAEGHLTDNYLFYEEQLFGLGSEFILSFEACMNYIQRHPLSYEKKYFNFRVGYVDRFPYGIFYLVNEKQKIILIAAIYFLHMNPKTIKKELRKI
ncbi:MAG TPA: type II toxin-antitoxin system RelE/ParE family toxin [Bacteroidia bacterium]|jgi:toxin ParE1/3/4|nr:type II toxin-antitoxin system RelE/ParE family toxin [Bacteroidia bacterium]